MITSDVSQSFIFKAAFTLSHHIALNEILHQRSGKPLMNSNKHSKHLFLTVLNTD